MRKLFLSSSFKDVANRFRDFAQEDVNGKTVTFIPTASIPEKIKFYVGSARKAFQKIGIIVDDLDVSQSSSTEIAEKLEQNDYIYVSGGNTFFLLQELRKKGAEKMIIDQIESGKLYIGESAGSMIVSPDIEYVKDMDDCKAATGLDTFSALGVIDFYPLPHYQNFPFTKAIDKIISKYASELKLYPISNNQMIWVKGPDVKIETSS
ncbi:MAG: Type 1 glutamine amidotransferase-like domain-containing protein [Tannerella sp.]|jgi:dipeptidase E|nr:Type 1 glutamine amidotransferase-like domain-containing protein [Tannerella sp.]